MAFLLSEKRELKRKHYRQHLISISGFVSAYAQARQWFMMIFLSRSLCWLKYIYYIFVIWTIIYIKLFRLGKQFQFILHLFRLWNGVLCVSYAWMMVDGVFGAFTQPAARCMDIVGTTIKTQTISNIHVWTLISGSCCALPRGRERENQPDITSSIHISVLTFSCELKIKINIWRASLTLCVRRPASDIRVQHNA